MENKKTQKQKPLLGKRTLNGMVVGELSEYIIVRTEHGVVYSDKNTFFR